MWVNPEETTLSETSQSQKDRDYLILLKVVRVVILRHCTLNSGGQVSKEEDWGVGAEWGKGFILRRQTHPGDEP